MEGEGTGSDSINRRSLIDNTDGDSIGGIIGIDSCEITDRDSMEGGVLAATALIKVTDR
jgi:hypothetical protein